MDIVKLTEYQIIMLAEDVAQAKNEYRDFRISTGVTLDRGAYVKWKIGGGIWTPPHFGIKE